MNADHEGLARLVHIAHDFLDPLARRNRVQWHDAAVGRLVRVRMDFGREERQGERDSSGFGRKHRCPLSLLRSIIYCDRRRTADSVEKLRFG